MGVTVNALNLGWIKTSVATSKDGNGILVERYHRSSQNLWRKGQSYFRLHRNLGESLASSCTQITSKTQMPKHSTTRSSTKYGHSAYKRRDSQAPCGPGRICANAFANVFPVHLYPTTHKGEIDEKWCCHLRGNSVVFAVVELHGTLRRIQRNPTKRGSHETPRDGNIRPKDVLSPWLWMQPATPARRWSRESLSMLVSGQGVLLHTVVLWLCVCGKTGGEGAHRVRNITWTVVYLYATRQWKLRNELRHTWIDASIAKLFSTTGLSLPSSTKERRISKLARQDRALRQNLPRKGLWKFHKTLGAFGVYGLHQRRWHSRHHPSWSHVSLNPPSLSTGFRTRTKRC